MHWIGRFETHLVNPLVTSRFNFQIKSYTINLHVTTKYHSLRDDLWQVWKDSCYVFKTFHVNSSWMRKKWIRLWMRFNELERGLGDADHPSRGSTYLTAFIVLLHPQCVNTIWIILRFYLALLNPSQLHPTHVECHWYVWKILLRVIELLLFSTPFHLRLVMILSTMFIGDEYAFQLARWLIPDQIWTTF